MKIAHFTESYHPVVNGVTRSIDTLVDALLERGHESVIYAPGARGNRVSTDTVKRFPCYYFPTQPDYPLALPFSRAMYREFAAQKFDVVHLKTPFAVGLCGLCLARRNQIPVVAHMHTLYVEYSHYI